MLVSVIMAARDATATIRESVDSVLSQTYSDWELIVVDDGSRDGTGEAALAAGDPRVRVLRREPVGVLGAVRNAGIAEAAGKAVALLDADDVWLPRKLELQVACLERRPEVGVVHTAAELLIGDERRPAPPGGRREPLLPALVASNFVYSSSALVRSDLLREHGAFDTDPRLGGAPDYDLWLRLAPHTAFAFLDEPLLLYRVHGAQMSTARADMQRAVLVALEKLAERDPELVRQHAAVYRTALGMHRQLAGEPGRGRRDLLYALWSRPWSPVAWRWLARSFVPRRSSAAA